MMMLLQAAALSTSSYNKEGAQDKRCRVLLRWMSVSRTPEWGGWVGGRRAGGRAVGGLGGWGFKQQEGGTREGCYGGED